MIEPNFRVIGMVAALIVAGGGCASTDAKSGASARTRYIDSDEDTGTSMAMVAGSGPLAHTTQLLPLDKNGALIGPGDVAAQTGQVLHNLSVALRAAESGLNHVVKVNVYLAQPEVLPKVQAAFAREFSGRVKPAVSFVAGKLSHPDALVAMDAVATRPGQAKEKAVQKFRSDKLAGSSSAAHVAVLPVGGAVYISGQADRGELAESTRKTLASLQTTLDYLGLRREQIVHLKAFVRPMSEVSLVEKEIARFFEGGMTPPVVFVEWVSSIPIEIELIAASPGDPAKAGPVVSYITPPGMTASPVYSKVARVNHGRKIYISGLYGRTSPDAEGQIREIFAALDQLLKKAGSDFRSLVKATYYVSDHAASDKLNELRPKFYDPQRPPAASKAMVPGVGLAGKSITFDMIAVAPE